MFSSVTKLVSKVPPELSSGVYISRKVLNGSALLEWMASVGFNMSLPSDELHITTCYSTTPFVPTPSEFEKTLSIPANNEERLLKKLGESQVTVLALNNEDLLNEWSYYRSLGASWNFLHYNPHITLTYLEQGLNLENIEPYRGAILLAPPVVTPLDPDFKESVEEQVLYGFQSIGATFNFSHRATPTM